MIDRAKEILLGLERNGARASTDLVGKESSVTATKRKLQLTLFEAERHPVLDELEGIDVSALSPVEALVKLDELQRRARE